MREPDRRMLYDLRTELPDGFLEIESSQISKLFPRPTLIHLRGQRPAPLFVSVLLHGNEDVGLKAIQQVLSHHLGRELPRSISLFIGNVDAAGSGLRRLRGQVDYNRVWPGTDSPEAPEAQMMVQIVEQMRERNVFASIDLHNNTGLNPHYACVCSTATSHLQLASIFSRTVVYFTRPRGTQTMAFTDLCPAVTCECGKVGDFSGVRHAADFLNAILHLSSIPDHPVADGDVHLFRTVATVKVPEDVRIAFGSGDGDLIFPEHLDQMNFCEVGPGTELACVQTDGRGRLHVWNESGEDVCSEYLSRVGNSIRLKKRLLPSMLTLDERVIRQDCLCYFMERAPAT